MNLKNLIKNNKYLYNCYVSLRDLVWQIIWLAKGRPVPPPHIIKQRRVLWAQKTFGLHTLVETGTFMGDMVNATLQAFDTVYSIELSDELWRGAQARFAGYPKVHILQGDSTTILPQLMENIGRPTLFWLDAHYSGDSTAKGMLDTPIAAELQCIFSSPTDGHVILIDDARLFVGKDGYPAIGELTNHIVEVKPHYNVDIKDDIIQIYPRY